MEPTGHITTLKPDKCLLSEVRDLFVGSVSTNGHEHTDRRVYFFPEEVFSIADNDGNVMFFVPIIPLNGKNEMEKRTVPIWECNFYPHHKSEIIMYGEKNGLEILYKHFEKPQISITYAERLEYETVSEDPDELI